MTRNRSGLRRQTRIRFLRARNPSSWGPMPTNSAAAVLPIVLRMRTLELVVRPALEGAPRWESKPT